MNQSMKAVEPIYFSDYLKVVLQHLDLRDNWNGLERIKDKFQLKSFLFERNYLSWREERLPVLQYLSNEATRHSNQTESMRCVTNFSDNMKISFEWVFVRPGVGLNFNLGFIRY